MTHSHLQHIQQQTIITATTMLKEGTRCHLPLESSPFIKCRTYPVENLNAGNTEHKLHISSKPIAAQACRKSGTKRIQREKLWVSREYYINTYEQIKNFYKSVQKTDSMKRQQDIPSRSRQA